MKANYEIATVQKKMAVEVKRSVKEISRSKATRKKGKKANNNEDDDDTSCIYCLSLYSNSKAGEKWIQCLSCRQWAHEECSFFNGKDLHLNCDNCA